MTLTMIAFIVAVVLGFLLGTVGTIALGESRGDRQMNQYWLNFASGFALTMAVVWAIVWRLGRVL